MKVQNSKITILILIGVLFLTISSVYAETAEGCFNRGHDYSLQGNWSQAISDYNKAIEINPNYWQAYLGRGIASYSQGNFTQTLSDYTKTIEINPNVPGIYGLRGYIYARLGNFAQAIHDLTKDIETNPNNASSYSLRSFSYAKLGEYDKAWTDVHKAQELGYTVDFEFLDNLKKASGRDK